MKIQLDTSSKIIKIEELVNLKELFDLLEQMLPNGTWKEFTLDTNTIIVNWKDPIVWPIYPIPIPNCPTYPNYPWYQPTTGDPLYGKYPITTCDTTNYSTNLNNGIYNIEI